MKRFTELFSGSSAMLFHVAITGWMFCLAKINNDFQAMSLNYLPLCAMLLLAYYLDRLMLHKGAPVPLFAVAQLVFVGLGVWIFTQSVYLQPFKLSTVIINCVIYCVGFFIACFTAWMPGNENSVLMRFDALAVMTVILLFLDEMLSLPAADSAVLFCAVCLVCLLVSSISMRSGRLSGRGSAVQGDPAVGRILLGLALAVMGGLAALLLAFATSGMKSFFGFVIGLAKKCLDAIVRFLLWLYGLVERFMEWLSRFASDAPMEPIENAQMGAGAESDVAMEAVQGLPTWLYGLLIAIVALLFVITVLRLRHVRVGRVHYKTAAVRVQKRRSGLKEAMVQLLARLNSGLLFRWRCLSKRRSAPALLVWCEKQVDKSLRRLPGESGEGFLRRLAGCGFKPELCDALLSLADCVERCFYSPCAVTVPAQVYKSLKRGKFKIENTDAD